MLNSLPATLPVWQQADLVANRIQWPPSAIKQISWVTLSLVIGI